MQQNINRNKGIIRKIAKPQLNKFEIMFLRSHNLAHLIGMMSPLFNLELICKFFAYHKILN